MIFDNWVVVKGTNCDAFVGVDVAWDDSIARFIIGMSFSDDPRFAGKFQDFYGYGDGGSKCGLVVSQIPAVLDRGLIWNV